MEMVKAYLLRRAPTGIFEALEADGQISMSKTEVLLSAFLRAAAACPAESSIKLGGVVLESALGPPQWAY